MISFRFGRISLTNLFPNPQQTPVFPIKCYYACDGYTFIMVSHRHDFGICLHNLLDYKYNRAWTPSYRKKPEWVVETRRSCETPFLLSRLFLLGQLFYLFIFEIYFFLSEKNELDWNKWYDKGMEVYLPALIENFNRRKDWFMRKFNLVTPSLSLHFCWGKIPIIDFIPHLLIHRTIYIK